jgi:hypothetical protein
MKKAFLCIFIIATSGLTGVSADDVAALLKPALNALYKQDAEPLVFSFGSFTYADRQLASEFSRYLENNLALAVKECPQFELFARDKLEEILEAQEMGLQDLFSQTDAVRIGNLKSIKAILSGRFFDAGGTIEVYLELASVETGAVLGSAKAVLRKRQIPRTVDLLPANYAEAVDTYEKINKVAVGENDNLDIKIWTKRGDGGVYRDGEEMTVHFITTANCYVKIYHIDVNGQAQLIFPNQHHMDNRVQKNRFYSIPGEGADFAFQLGKPYGTEFIKVVASVTQFRRIEEPFTPLGKASRGMITRGLPSTAAGAAVIEAILSYTIIKE